MAKRSELTRRDFLRGAATGAAVFGTAPFVFLPRRVWAYAGGESPHPNISPLRVVGVHDPRMTREQAPVSPWRLQEELVVGEAVEDNLDRMAAALAGQTNARDAWNAIFLKPPGKSWADVVVGVKVNALGSQYVQSPVLSKICRVLVEVKGVKSGNICIYDGIHGDKIGTKYQTRGLPDGCRLAGKWGGINTPAPIPGPWKRGAKKSDCINSFARREVDILVNIAVCKGHSEKFGGFTMTMKNHLGTFDPAPAHLPGSSDYLFSINKTPEILGEISPETGRVLFPRQQLCLVDALWASEGGPGGDPSCQPNRLFMGVFSPVVDYVVASRFRADTMGWKVDRSVLSRFLSEFGFREEDLPRGGQIIDALAV